MSSPRPLVIVTGLGRCGLTMVTQMLRAAGLPCHGHWPDYEEPPQAPCDGWHGKVVKLLWEGDGALYPNAPVIWMDRDVGQQAASQVKLAATTGFMEGQDKQRIRAGFREGLRSDRQVAMRALHAHDVLTLRFENVLNAPLSTITRIQAFLRLDFGRPWAMVDAVSHVVKPRPPACAPDLSIELSMLSEVPEWARD